LNACCSYQPFAISIEAGAATEWARRGTVQLSQLKGANLDTDTSSGTKFSVNAAGTISAIRLHRGAGNSATTVKLWTTTGTLLGTGTITGSAMGWVTGRISYNAAFFNAAVTVGPITMPSTSTSGGNGVYSYPNAFPDYTWNANNYWIDPVYTPTTQTGLTPPAKYNMLTIEIRSATTPTSNGIYLYGPNGTPLTASATHTFQGDGYLGWHGTNGRYTEGSNSAGGDIIQMGARPYMPTLGRFLGTDPYEDGNCNDYDYTCGDPVNWSDLSGSYMDAGEGGYTGVEGCISIECQLDVLIHAIEEHPGLLPIIVGNPLVQCLVNGGCSTPGVGLNRPLVKYVVIVVGAFVAAGVCRVSPGTVCVLTVSVYAGSVEAARKYSSGWPAGAAIEYGACRGTGAFIAAKGLVKVDSNSPVKLGGGGLIAAICDDLVHK
jgi:RHS repeat-associated protein